MIQELKNQLVTLQKELEKTKDESIQPKDIEMLRLQIEQELNNKHLGRIKLQETEIDKFRERFSSLRRQHEMMQTEMANDERRHGYELNELKRAHLEEVSVLQEKMREMQNSLMDTTELERLRKLQRENSELQLKVQSLNEELQERNASYEHHKQEWEHKERLLSRQVLEHATNEKQLLADVETLEKQVENTEAQSRKMSDAQEVLQTENNRLLLELERTKNKLEEVKHMFR